MNSKLTTSNSMPYIVMASELCRVNYRRHSFLSRSSIRFGRSQITLANYQWSTSSILASIFLSENALGSTLTKFLQQQINSRSVVFPIIIILTIKPQTRNQAHQQFWKFLLDSALPPFSQSEREQSDSVPVPYVGHMILYMHKFWFIRHASVPY